MKCDCEGVADGTDVLEGRLPVLLPPLIIPCAVVAKLQEPDVGENDTPSPHSWYLLHVCNSNPFHREKANLAITLHNDHEEIMAQATFLDYPNWNVTKQDDWVSVFQELDSEIPCTVGNRARGLLEQPELGRDVLGLHMLSFQFWE